MTNNNITNDTVVFTHDDDNNGDEFTNSNKMDNFHHNNQTFCIKIPTDGPDKLAQERVLKSIRNGNGEDNGDGNGSDVYDDVSNKYSNITCQIQITNECESSKSKTSSSPPTDSTDRSSSSSSSCCCCDCYCSCCYWMIQSFGINGQPKTIGGDEYYITYEEIQIITTTTKKRTKTKSDDDNNEEKEENEEECTRERTTTRTLVSTVAFITDNNNGTYKLDFCTTPTNPNIFQASSSADIEDATNAGIDVDDVSHSTTIECILTVYFEYSNYIGQMYPPTKNQWKDGGYTHTKYIVKTNTDDNDNNNNNYDDIIIQRPPNIRIFQPPSLSSRQSPNHGSLKLNNYNKVLVFGDSSYCQLTRQRPNKKGKYYFQPNIKFGEKIRIPLNTTTVSEFLQLLEEQHGNELRNMQQQQEEEDCDNQDDDDQGNSNSNNEHKTALLLGSSLWDLLDSYDTIQSNTKYEDHITAMRILLHEIHKLYPHAVIYWKLPTAIHVHVVDLQRLVPPPPPPPKSVPSSTQSQASTSASSPTLFGVDRVRYMSSSRSKFLYQLQKKLLDVEFSGPVGGADASNANSNNDGLVVHCLDLYDATYLSANQLYPSDGRHYRPDLNRLMLSWYYE